MTNYTKTYAPKPHKLYTKLKFLLGGCKKAHTIGCEVRCNGGRVGEKRDSGLNELYNGIFSFWKF